MKRLLLVLVLCAVATSVQGAEFSEHRVAMADGVELATDVYLPAATGAFPVVVIRTPYGKSGHRTFGETLAAAGYAVVVQDVRGKFASAGAFVPFLAEEKDGLATLDWIVKASWSNGRVGAFGTSYSGFAALLLVHRGHPSLKTAFSASGWISTEKINSPGGALHMMVGIPWLLFAGGPSQRALGDYDLDALFRHLPVSGVFDAAGVDVPSWKDRRVLRAYNGLAVAKANIPVLHMTGWYDFTAAASLDVWRAMRGGDRPQRLVVGPWIHGQIHTKQTAVGDVDAGPESVVGPERLTQLALEWFDCHLRGRCTPAPPVRVFVLGENRWRDFDSWPPRESRRHALFLARATLRDKPAREAGRTRFPFDPADPVPTLGGANFHFFPELAGPRDQRPHGSRPDVAVFTSGRLGADLVLAGPIRAVLHVATEGRDTDFTAKLVDVAPDGRALSIADGIARLAHRNGSARREPVEPGRVYELAIDLGDIAVRIPKGHRLRLDVASSNFPKFDRNPNTGEDPFEAAALQRVMQTVHHAPSLRSCLELTTLQPPSWSGDAAMTETPRLAQPAPVPAASADELLASGRALLAEKKVEEAVVALTRAAELEPKRSVAHYWLGRALAEQLQAAGTAEKVLLAGRTRRAFEKAVELDPSNLDARTSLARYYLTAPLIAGGSTKKAKEQADAIVAADPPRGHLLLARIHFERKEWNEAVAAYRRALEHSPANAELHHDLGLVYQELARWPEAFAAFEAAIAANPQHAQSWYQLGRSGALSGTNLERALEALDGYLTRFAASASATFQAGAWWRKGMILERLARPSDALAAYRHAAEIDPAHEEVRKAIARLSSP